MVYAFLCVADFALSLYIVLLIANAVFYWLCAFDIINARNPLVVAMRDFLYQITEPVLDRVRAFLPSFGALDVSPIVVFMAIYFVRIFMWRAYAGMFF
ncbi:YggT family protein [Bartonella ancashensis]|uniref:Integral membrane protein YggT, involved in response to extracytoplasmic stress (Osmotic shock) n=1 Tax=Bartonella ancashensis TaxID=1318743 RepID=A0A0M4L957_9HYPH|nr:YggT family protein [Bartonella ancashensis]ALE04138.1 Integral membrane protein YggT, involved in response to extracytoplasmic stress (osmotic shock) [Bartonella ancashensis]